MSIVSKSIFPDLISTGRFLSFFLGFPTFPPDLPPLPELLLGSYPLGMRKYLEALGFVLGLLPPPPPDFLDFLLLVVVVPPPVWATTGTGMGTGAGGDEMREEEEAEEETEEEVVVLNAEEQGDDETSDRSKPKQEQIYSMGFISSPT